MRLTSKSTQKANRLESNNYFRNIFYFLFGYYQLDKVEPPKDSLKNGYSKILTVRYFARDRWFIISCRYYFETKRLRFFNDKNTCSGSVEPLINNNSFYWKVS